jgi:hypothetical protein
MMYVIRAADGDYWSNNNGWTEHRHWASYYSRREDIEDFILADFASAGVYVDEVPNYVAGRAARQAIMDDRDGDWYGWAMSWLFAICDRITFETDSQVPAEWEFRPSPLGPSNDDEYKIDIMSYLCEYQLLYVGEVLHRYIARLKKLGKDY